MHVAHALIGWSIVVAFGVLFLWGILTWIIRRGPGRAFWWLLTFVQVTLLLQFLAGTILLLAGGSRPLLHYVYGIIFPGLVLGVAHVVAREQLADRPWLAFTAASFFSLGLTLRALMTGFGIG